MITIHRQCVCCNSEVDGWVPFRGEGTHLSEFVLRTGPIGSALERFGCPKCGCSDRDRHLLLYLEALGILDTLASARILHIAPEEPLRQEILRREPATLITGDLVGQGSIEKVDITRMSFADGSFDLIICNHVLEHVHDLRSAFKELARTLRPGGRLICQTPFSRRLSRTFEESDLESESDRLFFYGQEDHVRLFGRDLEGMLLAHGFSGGLRRHGDLLPDKSGEAYGVNEDEPFFDFILTNTQATTYIYDSAEEAECSVVPLSSNTAMNETSYPDGQTMSAGRTEYHDLMRAADLLREENRQQTEELAAMAALLRKERNDRRGELERERTQYFQMKERFEHTIIQLTERLVNAPSALNASDGASYQQMNVISISQAKKQLTSLLNAVWQRMPCQDPSEQVSTLKSILLEANIVDSDWYLKRYNDVRERGCEPVQHFAEYGISEGRSPSPIFDYEA